MATSGFQWIRLTRGQRGDFLYSFMLFWTYCGTKQSCSLWFKTACCSYDATVMKKSLPICATGPILVKNELHKIFIRVDGIFPCCVCGIVTTSIISHLLYVHLQFVFRWLLQMIFKIFGLKAINIYSCYEKAPNSVKQFANTQYINITVLRLSFWLYISASCIQSIMPPKSTLGSDQALLYEPWYDT